MRRITLPDGGWVELREKADLRVKHTHLLQAAVTGAASAMRKLPDNLPEMPDDPAEKAALLATLNLDDLMANGALTFDEARSLQRIQEVTVAVFTVAWSLKAPPPTIDTVGDMEEHVYDAIAAATKNDAAAAMAGTDFSPTPKDTPENPTGPAEDSNGHSKAGEESQSTQPLSLLTASSSSES